MRGKKRCPVGLLAVVLGCASSNAGNGEDDGATSGAGDGGSGDAGSGDGGSTSGGGGSGGSGSDGSGASSGGSAGTTGGSGTDGSGPDGCALADLLDEPTYNDMFLHREDPACEGGVYSYAGLLDAAAAHPKFACEGTGEQRLQEVAAFLAQIGHETTGGWPTAPDGPHAWGLCFVEEVGCAGGACTQYCDAGNAQYPCAPGKTYHGRGAIQLSWNYNYGQAGDALGVDILSDPDRVATDGELAISTALWFWMTEQLPKPSAHDVMVGNWVPDPADEAAGRLPGFGATTMIINGGIECTRPTPAGVEDRVGFYSSFCDALSVDTGENLYCDQMQPFG